MCSNKLEEFRVGSITTDYSQLFLTTLRWISVGTLSVLFAFTLQGNRAACFPMHIGIRVGDPCQDACEGFGFQEKSKVVALLNGVFTSYAYCCQFGTPQISSVVMLTRLASEAILFLR